MIQEIPEETVSESGERSKAYWNTRRPQTEGDAINDWNINTWKNKLIATTEIDIILKNNKQLSHVSNQFDIMWPGRTLGAPWRPDNAKSANNRLVLAYDTVTRWARPEVEIGVEKRFGG